jgi:hypothetical protein
VAFTPGVPMRHRVLVGLLAMTTGLAASSTPAGAQASTGTVAGTVTDAGGTPLRGVCVELYADEYRVAVSDGQGAYRFDGVPEGGDYLVAFNACRDAVAGHAAEFYDNAAGFSDAAPVTVRAGQVQTGIDAQLEPAATISGTVTDETSNGRLEGTCVLAFELENGLFAEARTGADGAYALANLRGGEYLVAFGDCSDPFNHMSELYDGALLDLPVGGIGVQPEPTTVRVQDGEHVDGIDAALTEGGSVVGTVTTRHTGRPAGFLCVGLFATDAEPDSPDAVTVTGFRPDGTSAPGQYVVAGVPPGDYVVGFNPEQVCGDDGYEPQWARGQSGRDDAAVLSVRRGEAVRDVDAVIAARPSISYACFFGPSGGSRFNDVSSDNVHADAIECLADYGIASGRGDGSYGPADAVRRDQMATFVVGALDALGVELPADPPNAFPDDDGNAHERAIDQLAALGVVTGRGDGRYHAADPVSRAQLATFLVRGYERSTGFALLAPDDAFADDDGTSHEPSIDRAATAGLAAGTTDRAYRPGGDVRRDQMATFVARLVDRVQRDRGEGGVFFAASGSSESTVVGPPGTDTTASLRRLVQDAAGRLR